MRSRHELHEILVEKLGSRNVYFQPPESVKLSYPCIIYERETGRDFRADDLLYNYRKSYNLTVMDKDPDSTVPDDLLQLPMCSFDRFYATDNINHWVFTIYY